MREKLKLSFLALVCLLFLYNISPGVIYYAFICNLFGQDKFGYDGSRYTSYDAVYDGLTNLKNHMLINRLTSVSFPYKMSSVRGGANWEIIYCMICQVFKDSYINIEIWKIE